ncbi:MAG: Disulfide-bond oxidoreductase YfcG [Alphaproteobacteria bacterium MarineAlpha9_Bin3]|nr:MAG: Disulfide-bond oxidoreductase YfcG [Alphaproteobacteria bacterium MarineAlpha9_Bin3]|tara:strand:- start:106 stop:738 length:633 start_codon:yes stop_codon:yes gene_type:complete
MIDFYSWSTPNGRKVSIMLEECKLDYNLIPINITKDEQFEKNFLNISPNNKIPAIYDHDTNISMMESGAILLYLSEKTGVFLPKEDKDRWKRDEWLMFQMASLGPMLGQVHHFIKFNSGKSAYAEERYYNEAKRIYGVLDKRLEESEFVAGNDYGVADISIWPWVSRYEWQNIDLNNYINILRWYKEIASREAVIKGYDIPKMGVEIPIP